MTHDKLANLITLLKQSGVTHYKTQFIEIQLGASIAPVQSTWPMQPLQGETIHTQGDLIPSPAKSEHIQMADDAMSYDQILNWSASPDLHNPKTQDKETLPMTGDTTL